MTANDHFGHIHHGHELRLTDVFAGVVFAFEDRQGEGGYV
jgi:hypothetical protein